MRSLVVEQWYLIEQGQQRDMCNNKHQYNTQVAHKRSTYTMLMVSTSCVALTLLAADRKHEPQAQCEQLYTRALYNSFAAVIAVIAVVCYYVV
eukprot:8409-Heterococcus_DN1.PRE.2